MWCVLCIQMSLTSRRGKRIKDWRSFCMLIYSVWKNVSGTRKIKTIICIYKSFFYIFYYYNMNKAGKTNLSPHFLNIYLYYTVSAILLSLPPFLTGKNLNWLLVKFDIIAEEIIIS